MNELFSVLPGTQATYIDFLPFCLNFFSGLAIAAVITTYYVRVLKRSLDLSFNATILMLYAVGILLIGTVVQYSLSLSLGLVGAISVVRFRTPVRNPLDLVYLLILTAVCISASAGYLAIAAVGAGSVLLIQSVSLLRSDTAASSVQNLTIHLKKLKSSEASDFASLLTPFGKATLVNLQSEADWTHYNYQLSLNPTTNIGELERTLQDTSSIESFALYTQDL